MLHSAESHGKPYEFAEIDIYGEHRSYKNALRWTETEPLDKGVYRVSGDRDHPPTKL